MKVAEVNNKNIKTVMDLVKTVRTLLDWKQTKMAAVLGVRQATISDWETGKSCSRELLIGAKLGYAAAKHGLTIEEFAALVPDPDGELTDDHTI